MGRGEAAEERPDFIWDSISDIRTLLQSDKEERQ